MVVVVVVVVEVSATEWYLVIPMVLTIQVLQNLRDVNTAGWLEVPQLL